ncbi:GDSL-type esterase/lipase family protein [Actinoplanes sp. TRM 88003]|uniref:GDSL-type esterase/lipase family protein n=1 Tax=Paractinoplanes aksuensis TaxID=2939490 RepID=A0ABT1DS20_9ACTN|nr:GDSL-type esterase/lipase family protein [Actinoplanes aksuensis]MCO8273629.1 GDSL-type esterase/lipase family protein [Actinoplanes aksuensis]
MMDAPLTSAYTDAERRHFLRYTRTRSWPMLQRFPVGDELHTELLAQMLASSAETIRALESSLAEEAGAVAARLLTDPEHRAAVARLPFRPDDRIVAVGDSITADRLGWFDLLAHSVGSGPVLVNLGVSGNTTADVLERFDVVEAARPTRVLLMLGTNDVRVHGRTGGHRMTTAPETERNLRALVDLVTRDLGATVTVITPPAVDQRRIDEFFRDGPVRWRADEVAEVAEVVRKVAPDAVDLHTATADQRPDHLLEPDGVHPSRTGQRFILSRIVAELGARS